MENQKPYFCSLTEGERREIQEIGALGRMMKTLKMIEEMEAVGGKFFDSVDTAATHASIILQYQEMKKFLETMQKIEIETFIPRKLFLFNVLEMKLDGMTKTTTCSNGTADKARSVHKVRPVQKCPSRFAFISTSGRTPDINSYEIFEPKKTWRQKILRFFRR
ncbi:uncharacterized protein [Magallana gigas]|uniref:uncharacterized protein n=1 Tax=Magallana gigas TaxID=29159 RepID=UPI0005C3C7F7|eukprot:XP_011423322.1 PREDICTED: uncharacterized protein LOC105325446 [Crassostrea gigas]